MVIFFQISGSSSYYFHYLINLLLTSQIKGKCPGEKFHLFLPFLCLLAHVSRVNVGFPSCDYGGLDLLRAKLNATIYALVISRSYFQNFSSAILLLSSLSKTNKTPLLIPHATLATIPFLCPP